MGESLDLFAKTTEVFNTKKEDANTYSPLTLAYIGDGIYEIVIRTFVVTKDGNEQVNKLHKKSANLVKAQTQSEMIKAVMEELNEEEVRVFKRGRNAKSFTSAKNASIQDYRMATGFEALIGYLYIEGKMERLFEICKMGIERIQNS